MEKPKPKHEVVITSTFFDDWSMIIVYGSADAREWLLKNLPDMGKVYSDSDGMIVFHINRLYDKAEVRAYIESYEGGQS